MATSDFPVFVVQAHLLDAKPWSEKLTPAAL